MYPPAVTRCQAARSTTTDRAPSPTERDVARRRKPPGGTRPRMLLRWHQVSPEPLAGVRLRLDVLGVVGPGDHHLDGPEQFVDVLPLLSGVEVRELPDASLDRVCVPLEPLVGGERGLPG